MSAKQEAGWVPLSGCVIPELFNTDYQGNFSNVLQVHQPRLTRFLNIASLDGRLLLTDKPPVRHREIPNPQMNADGSLNMTLDNPLANHGSGRARTISKAAMLQPDRLGWTLSIDDNQLTEDLMAKNGGQARGIEPDFAKQFNRHFTRGLEVALIRDKLTRDKDPYITGKGGASLLYMSIYASVVEDLVKTITSSMSTLQTSSFGLGLITIGMFVALRMYSSHVAHTEFDRKNAEKFGTDYRSVSAFGRHFYQAFDPDRRTLKSRLEFAALPLELDRVLLAEGYLSSLKLTRKPFVRLAR